VILISGLNQLPYEVLANPVEVSTIVVGVRAGVAQDHDRNAGLLAK